MLAKLLVIVPFALVVGCSSPEEQAKAYYEKGMALLKEGKADKAQIEFRNALQIKKNMGPAIYGMALVVEQKGDWPQLFKLLTATLEQDPKNLEARVKLGRLLLAAGQLDKALETSNKALEVNGEDLSALSLHAAVLLKLNDSKGALEYAHRALSRDPNHVDSLVVLASERLFAGDSAKAIEYLDIALKQNEKNIALQLIKIEAYNKLAQLENAEQIFRKLIQFYPDAKQVRQALASFYLQHEKKDEAEKELRTIVEQFPTDIQAKLELVQFLAGVKGLDVARKQFEGFVAKDPNNYPLNLALVEFYMNGRDATMAEGKLKEIIAKAGNTADGLRAKAILAASMITRGDKKSAEHLIDEVLAQDKRNEQALLLKAGLALDAGKTDDAIADLRTILVDVPNSSRALLLLAQAHEQAAAPELAEEHYLRAFKASRMSAPYGIAFAQYLLKRNQAGRAEKILEETLANAPGQLQAMKMLAQARMAQGDWAGAQQVADELKKQGDKGKSADLISGSIAAGQRNFVESISAFKRAYEASPQETQPLMGLVRAYLLAGKTSDAQSFLDSVIKSNPENLDARLMQAQLYAMSGNKDKAIAAYNAIISQSPNRSEGYQRLAVLYLRSNQAGEAEKVVAQGLAAIPKDLNLRFTQAGVFETAKKNKEAIQVYESLLKDKPDSDVVINNLASLLADFSTSKADIERVYGLVQRFKKSEVPQFKDTAGWVSYRMGKFDEAIALLEGVAKQMPDVPVFHFHLGMSYLSKGDKAKARTELEKALQLAGNSPFDQADEIRRTLKSL